MNSIYERLVKIEASPELLADTRPYQPRKDNL